MCLGKYRWHFQALTPFIKLRITLVINYFNDIIIQLWLEVIPSYWLELTLTDKTDKLVARGTSFGVKLFICAYDCEIGTVLIVGSDVLESKLLTSLVWIQKWVNSTITLEPMKTLRPKFHQYIYFSKILWSLRPTEGREIVKILHKIDLHQCEKANFVE